MGIKTPWDVLEHKWENFRRWIEECEKSAGEDASIQIRTIKKTMLFADRAQDAVDKAILDSFEKAKPVKAFLPKWAASMRKPARRPCFLFWFVGWDCISLGFHVCFSAPNIEIHLPFSFLRIGWEIYDADPEYVCAVKP